MQRTIQRVTTGVGVLLLVFLLIACGGGGSSSNATPSTVLATYNGSGFTMKYPQGWKTTASSAEVDFTDTTGNTLT
ncbi:MAG: hypothetical protein ABI234_10710, partial [Ktedonobacteraceae bacterium]